MPGARIPFMPGLVEKLQVRRHPAENPIHAADAERESGGFLRAVLIQGPPQVQFLAGKSEEHGQKEQSSGAKGKDGFHFHVKHLAIKVRQNQNCDVLLTLF